MYHSHGSLHSVPFHALKWSDNEYIIEKFGICYVPSASTLRYCQTKNLLRTNSSDYRPNKCIVVCSGAKSDYTEFEKDIDFLSQCKWNQIVSLRAARDYKAKCHG